MKDGNWCVAFGSCDEWDVNEEFETKEEAIEYGKKYIADDLNEEWMEFWNHESFAVGQIVIPVFKLYKDKIEEEMENFYYDECGEFSENHEVSNMDVLEKRLNDVIRKWELEFDNVPKFCSIENIETILFAD